MPHKGPVVFVLMLIMAAIVMAQGWWEKKPYTEWSKDEVTNMLEKSPWACVHRESLEKVGHVRMTSSGDASGAEMAYDKLRFNLCFLTAKPIRMALARRTMLADPGDSGRADLGKYVEQEDDKNIMLLLTFSAAPPGTIVEMVISDLLSNLKTSELANRTYLATDGGKKVPLAQFDPIGANGYGVKFIFPRNLPDGSPLVAAGNKEIRFEMVLPLPRKTALELPKSIRIIGKWDLRKMVYQGKVGF